MHNNKLQLTQTRQKWFSLPLNTTKKSQPLPSSVDLTGTHTSLYHCLQLRLLTLDQNLSFQQHISCICQTCYLELHRISTIHHYLSQEALKTLICASVLSRIDYCNSLLVGCPKHLLQKLQHNATSLICWPKFDHISPILRTFHWLPVEQRITYKLFLCLQGGYMCNP